MLNLDQPARANSLQQLSKSFTYDPVGNRTGSHLATGQVHDAANRLLADSNLTLSYDANGNLVEQVSKANGDRTVYTYSVDNQLLQVEKFTVVGGLSPVLTAVYRYDALGRRIAKEVTQAGTTTITRYIYDNEDILLEFDGANVLQARYTHGPGIDEPLIMLRGTQSFFYHADGLGSVWDLTNSTGTVARSYVYDSFGQILAQTGTVANPFTYTGRELDAETDLHSYRARYYDPTVGRFLQEDPLGFAGGSSNFYEYALSNPVIFTDPTGLATFIGCRPVQGFPLNRFFDHCFIRIIPEPGSTLGSDPLTLSLLTEDPGFPRPGTAQKALNAPVDLPFDAPYRVAVPCTIGDADLFDQAVLNAFRRHPETILYSNNPFNRLGIFNSNTFVRRIIESAGGQLPIGIIGPVRAPVGMRAPRQPEILPLPMM